MPIWIGSKGDGGNVTQTNASLAAALGGECEQDRPGHRPDAGQRKAFRPLEQDPKCGCSSDALYSQSAGQEAKNYEWADSDAESKQVKPSNVNTPG